MIQSQREAVYAMLDTGLHRERFAIAAGDGEAVGYGAVEEDVRCALRGLEVATHDALLCNLDVDTPYIQV